MPDAMVAASALEATSGGTTQQFDVVVVGAGFAGLYLLHRLRKAGFTTVVVDEADDVGGLLQHHRREAGLAQPIQKVEAGKPGTHHHDVDLLRRTAARRF